MAFKLSIVIHIISFILLLSGIFIGLRAAREKTPSADLLKSIQFGYLLPGSVLVLLTGFYQFFYKGPGYYFSQGWFHGKFTFGLLLVAIALWLFTRLSKVQATGIGLKRTTTAIMHSVVGLLLFATVGSVILGR